MSLSSTKRGGFENYFRIVRVTIATTSPFLGNKSHQTAIHSVTHCQDRHAVIFGNPFQGAPCQVPWFFLAMRFDPVTQVTFCCLRANLKESYEQSLIILHNTVLPLEARTFEKMQIFQEDQKTISALIKLLVGIFFKFRP